MDKEIGAKCRVEGRDQRVRGEGRNEEEEETDKAIMMRTDPKECRFS
jgi:hypothetical protein